MIDVNQVFEQVVILSRKGQTGDYNGEEFNAQQGLVQSLLFDWYFSRWEKDQMVPDALRPFIREPELLVTDGILTLPDDYRHRLEVAVGYLVSGSDPVYYECPYLQAHQEAVTVRSYVRKPSLARNRYFHTIQASSIKVVPIEFNGVARLKYLANPAAAVWNSTIDTDENVEEYTSSGSVHFEWTERDETNLVDLFLYLKGITTRQSELLEWTAQKNILAKT